MPRARLLTGLAVAFGIAAAIAPWVLDGRLGYDLLRGPLFLIACIGAWWAAKRGDERSGPVLEAVAVGCGVVLVTWLVLRIAPLASVEDGPGSQLARAYGPAATWLQALLPLTWLVARLRR